MSSTKQKAAVVILFDKQGKILVHDRSRKTTTSEHYGFLGGKVEHGESVSSAATREVFEETTYTPSDLIFYKKYEADDTGTNGFEVHVFIGSFPGFEAFKDSEEVLVEELELKSIPEAERLQLFPTAYQILADLKIDRAI